MSAKKTSKPEVSILDQGINAMLKSAAKDAEKNHGFNRLVIAAEAHKLWKYCDFLDITRGTARPCIALEWLFGTRGTMNGRILKLDAEEATGKSSFLYLLYGMFLAGGGAFVYNNETERAVMPPDRIAHLGCDPHKLMIYRPAGVVDCLDQITKTVVMLRDVDKADQYPIIVGIDSVSALANQGLDLETGEVSEGGSGAVGFHSRKFSEFFRNQLDYFEARNVHILCTGQIKDKISTMPGVPSSKTTIADGAFKYHASWIVRMTHSNVTGEDAELVTLRTTKNKLAPKGRELKFKLYRDTRGWDLTSATANLLTASYAPLPEFKAGGGYFSHPELNGGKNLRCEDFVDAFYANTDLVQRCREAWKIRGFGFKFEDDFERGVAQEIPDDEADEEQVPANITP